MAAKTTTTISREYQVSLFNFWSGRSRTAIEHLSKLLADDPQREDQFLLYRLWIEILADLSEETTLAQLQKHLETRSESDPEFRPTYMALRGLIHFELDEISGAMLLAKGVSTYTNDPYCLELLHLTEQRTATTPIKCSLLKFKDKITDYYHFQTLARSLSMQNDMKTLEMIMKQVTKYFNDAPLALVFKMHVNLENENFAEAKGFAMKLLEKFPGQMDYSVYAAFAAIKSGDNASATELLEKAVTLGAENDVDATCLLGSCYTDMYQQTDDEAYREKGEVFLSRAATMLEDVGYSAVVPSFHETLLSDAAKDSSKTDDGVETHTPHIWLIKLSAANFHEIRTKAEEELWHITRPMGETPKPGDLVFFAGDDYQNKDNNTWRLAAVFTVASQAKWHPLHGFENSLQLVSRPEIAIPLDVHFLERNAKKAPKSPNKNHPMNYGVYEVDVSAVETITKAIKDYTFQDDASSDRIVEEIHRMRRIS